MENDLIHADEPVIAAGDVARLGEHHVPDIVELLNQMPPEEAATALADFPVERAAEVLDQPGLDDAAGLIEALPEDKAAVMSDLKDVYAEAKGNGFDVKTLRKVVRIRKQDRAKRQEEEAILDLYLSAIGEI